MLILVCLAAYLVLLAWCILFLRGSNRLKTPQPHDDALAEEDYTAPQESTAAQQGGREPAYRHNKGLVRKVG